MKSFFLIPAITIIFISGCDKSGPIDNSVLLNDNIPNEAVDKYVSLLKKSNYDKPLLPDFTYEDIPALLHYRNDSTTITNFPHNPISSFYQPECRLGIYVLWTIESIRAVAVKSKYLILNFPSQNPVLALRGEPELTIVMDSSSQSAAAKAYYNWWKDNINKPFDEFKNIDPLEKTGYFWH